tara:strand:+ start:1098 stop:1349 length:252 start_codon:yes stop_codon:yes gene_type:complete
MASYAVIENGLVVNVAEAEADYAAEQGWVLLTEGAGIGWSYVDGEFVDLRPAPEPMPAPPSPTKEELLAQLQALQAQITALGE